MGKSTLPPLVSGGGEAKFLGGRQNPLNYGNGLFCIVEVIFIKFQQVPWYEPPTPTNQGGWPLIFFEEPGGWIFVLS